MNVIRFIEITLQEKGFEGLVVAGMCGCHVGELSPANCLSGDCEPAYKHNHSQRPEDWIMSTNKYGITDDDIEKCIRDCC